MADQLVGDELFFEVLAGVTTVEEEQRLKDIALALDMDVDEEVQGRRALVRLIQTYLNGDDFAALDRPVMDEALQNVWNMLQPQQPQADLDLNPLAEQEDAPPPAEENNLENRDGEDLALGDDAAKLALPDLNPLYPTFRQPQVKARKTPDIKGLGVKKEDKEAEDSVMLSQNGGGAPITLKLKRLNELKITGKIGEPGEEGKLDQSNLLFQINSAKDRGYSDAEICSAVVNSITPGNDLRGLFEGVENLTLEFLLEIIDGYFKMQDAASVLRKMEKTVQGKENAFMFCMKLIRMKQNYARLAKKEEKEYFDHKYVQGRFHHALYTGLKDSAIRQQLKPLLKNVHTPDETLLKEIKELYLLESECAEKQEESKKPEVITVNSLQNTSKSAPKPPKPDNLTCTINELRAGQAENQKAIANLTSLVTDKIFADERRNNNQKGGNVTWRRKGSGFCEKCVASGAKYCRHCFRCGSQEHKICDCPVIEDEKNE